MDQVTHSITSYIEEHIRLFHKKRIDRLNQLVLIQELNRKNPYFFILNNILLSHDIVKSIIDENLSYLDESILTEFLKEIAIFINANAFNGRPSSLEGIDLEFCKDTILYLVAIKSRSEWGNRYQIQKMRDCFCRAKEILHRKKPNQKIIAVNGCCYGIEKKPNKRDYFKYCGQEFWEFISGDPEMYTKITEPIRLLIKEKDNEFYESYMQLINKFTLEFSQQFCVDGKIDWTRIVQINSSF